MQRKYARKHSKFTHTDGMLIVALLILALLIIDALI